MRRKATVLVKRDEKEILKVQIDKKLFDELTALKEDIQSFDKSIVFDVDSLCESALQKAIKLAREELDKLRKQ